MDPWDVDSLPSHYCIHLPLPQVRQLRQLERQAARRPELLRVLTGASLQVGTVMGGEKGRGTAHQAESGGSEGSAQDLSSSPAAPHAPLRLPPRRSPRRSPRGSGAGAAGAAAVRPDRGSRPLRDDPRRGRRSPPARCGCAAFSAGDAGCCSLGYESCYPLRSPPIGRRHS